MVVYEYMVLMLLASAYGSDAAETITQLCTSTWLCCSEARRDELGLDCVCDVIGAAWYAGRATKHGYCHTIAALRQTMRAIKCLPRSVLRLLMRVVTYTVDGSKKT